VIGQRHPHPTAALQSGLNIKTVVNRTRPLRLLLHADDRAQPAYKAPPWHVEPGRVRLSLCASMTLLPDSVKGAGAFSSPRPCRKAGFSAVKPAQVAQERLQSLSTRFGGIHS
jgi:hypothetical protein